MKRVLVVVGAVALLSAGCGNGDSSSPAASASSPSGTTSGSSASEPTWTVQEAGQHYLAMTRTTIADINRLKGLPDTTPVPVLTSACQAIADDMGTMLADADAGSWPTQVQPLMDQWSTAVTEQRAFFAQCGSAETIADAQAALTPVGEHNSVDESAAVRAALGLGPPQA